MELMWGTDSPSQSAVTEDMLASDFLDPAKDAFVTREENPLFHGIFKPTQEIIEAWLRRCSGTFSSKLQAVVSSGTLRVPFTCAKTQKTNTTPQETTHNNNPIIPVAHV